MKDGSTSNSCSGKVLESLYKISDHRWKRIESNSGEVLYLMWDIAD